MFNFKLTRLQDNQTVYYFHPNNITGYQTVYDYINNNIYIDNLVLLACADIIIKNGKMIKSMFGPKLNDIINIIEKEDIIRLL